MRLVLLHVGSVEGQLAGVTLFLRSIRSSFSQKQITALESPLAPGRTRVLPEAQRKLTGSCTPAKRGGKGRGSREGDEEK